MLPRLLHYLLVLYLLSPLLAMADATRFMRGQAIITAPYRKPIGDGYLAATSNQLYRIKGESFSALSNDPLSATAVRVSITRKTQNHSGSERFLKSRSPCNTPVIKRLLRTSKTLSCEPNWEVKTTLTPNDSFYSQLYSADSTSAGRIHLPEAWSLSTGSSNVVIGIIDTGVDYLHPDLQANIWTNPGEIAGNGIDDEGNGYIDDVHGIDTYNNDSDPMDDRSHGTHVAGIIGAVGNNSRGVVGIAWQVQQIGCKAFNAAGIGTVSAIVRCLTYLADLKNTYGINIVATNNSYGGFPYTSAMYNAIAATRDAAMVYVAGAGNNGTDNDATPFYPASFDLDNIISVGAIDSHGNKAGFSNYGATSVDISAPGVNVLSTIRNNQYAYYNGTSMATPHVTGAVALLMAYHPSYAYSQAINSILSSGTVREELFGQSASGAILNVEQALLFDAPAPTPGPSASPTPIETLTPTPSPTLSPGEIPEAFKVDISALNSHLRSVVTCSLSALVEGTYVTVPGHEVALAIKGLARRRRATTNNDGNASFTVRPPRGKSQSCRCQVAITNPQTNKTKIMKSGSAKLKLTKR